MVVAGANAVNYRFSSRATAQSTRGSSAVSRDAISDIKLGEMPKLIWRTIAEPGSKTGINLIKKLPIVMSFVWAPLLLFGLIMRRQLDQQLVDLLKFGAHPEDHASSQNPPEMNETLVSLSRIYPIALTGMMFSGVINGLGYAAFCRILPYTLLTISSLRNVFNENEILKRAYKLQILLEELAHIPPEDKDQRQQIQAQINDIISKITGGIGGLDVFSRIFFPLWMSLTFFSNVTQAAGKDSSYNCIEPEGENLGEMSGSIKEHFAKNMQKEFRAGWDFSKDLISPKKWSGIIKTFIGRDESFEAMLKEKGKYGNFKETLIAKMQHPVFNRNFNLLNMYLKVITSIGTLAAVGLWGSNKVFLAGDPNYESIDPEVKRLAEEGKKEKAWVKRLFDIATLIGNVGLAVLGFSSILQGLSKEYRSKTGPISPVLQIIGGVSVLLSAIFDQCQFFLTGAAFRYASNGALQLANALGACAKSMIRLTGMK
ncbi:MAG: hypothetical protein SFT81_04210 [Candidatus Caenarcaniphilales bacterium]|nr:hypothetical protein [Candidatus Caenarcaniphilales bacterium]